MPASYACCDIFFSAGYRALFKLLGPHPKHATFLINYDIVLRFILFSFLDYVFCNKIVRGMHGKNGFQRGQELPPIRPAATAKLRFGCRLREMDCEHDTMIHAFHVRLLRADLHSLWCMSPDSQLEPSLPWI